MSARRSLGLAPSPASNHAHDVASAFVALLKTLEPYADQIGPALRALLGAAGEGDELVEVGSILAPLGLKRPGYAACRRGEIEASKRGRRWYASRDATLSWVRKGGPRLVPDARADGDEHESRIEAMRRELAAGSGSARRSRRSS